jgi:putative membrane protein (TIGR04086 family)
MSSSSEANNSGLKRVVFAVLKGVLFTIILMLALSVAMSAVGAPDFTYLPVMMLALFAGGFFTGFSSTSRTASQRLVTGIISGLCFFFIILLLSLIINKGEQMNAATVFINLGVTLVGAIIGTIVHINSYSRRRTV